MFNSPALDLIQNKLSKIPQNNYPVNSRIHPLSSFSNSSEICPYIKRDDELGFGISGIKFRKYRTLIPFLLQEGCIEAIVIGGAFSNHVLSITQLLLENGIKPTLFLKGPAPLQKKGNFLFLQMLVPNNSIHWVPKDNWSEIDHLVAAYASSKEKVIIIPEGAPFFQGFLGALTLPLDIIRNESEMGLSFDHLFLDVGTGFSAAALLLAFAFLQKSTTCHCLLIAGTEDDFLKQLKRLHGEFEKWLGVNFPFPTQFNCLGSPIAPSFGSTNRELFDFIIQTSRKEGFFLDPIYSGKVFHRAKQMMDSNQIQGNVLLIHSGGALTLAGFQENIAKSLV